MQFLVIHSYDELNVEQIDEYREIFNNTTSILCNHINYEWISPDKKTLFLGRNPKIVAYDKYEVYNSDKNNLSFINGWVKKVSQDFLLKASEINFNSDDELDGVYVMGKLNENGEGHIKRSLESPPIYYAKNNAGYALSSRIFTLSKLFDYDEINKKHVASHIEFQNLEVTNETIYKNIFYVPLGTEIILSDELILNENPDFLYDPQLDKLYQEDSAKYWDECYKRINSQVNAFVNANLAEHIVIGITGGMDSRLSISFFKDYVKEAFTWGPVFSPEVMIGKMICDKLGIEHKTPTLTANISSENLLNRIPIHIFDRQFEMSPWDLGRLFCDEMDEIRIDGHEFLKKEVYTKDMGIDDYLKIIKKDFSHNDIIKDEHIEKIIEDDTALERHYLENIDDIRKYKKLRLILGRGRWFSAAHETEFNHRFNILPLVSDTLIKFNYNSSVNSINNLECHYELIKRSNPELLDIPFFNNEFKQKPLPPIENKINNGLNYKHIYITKYYDFIISFINENYYLISDIVKKSFIDEITIERLNKSITLSQQIYNILQAIILFKIEDSYKLKEEFRLDLDIENIENDDDNTENTIDAFIAYNKDIAELKIENQNLIGEISELKNFKKSVINSKSWKITKPLRHIFKQFK